MTERHTYVVVAITALFTLALLVGLLIMYKNLAPLPKCDNVVVSTTGQISLELKENEVPQVRQYHCEIMI